MPYLHPEAQSREEEEVNDVADVRLSEAGARSLTRNRDSSSQSVYEVRFTEPASFLDDLKADAELGAIEDRIVRLAIIGGPATHQQIAGDEFDPNGGKVNPWGRSRYVTASYQARGQLVKMTAYCGVSWAPRDKAPTEFWAAKTKDCALKLQSTLRQLQAPLQRLDLDVRGGGVYTEDPTDPWMGHYLASIETPAPVVCQHCGEEIYFANEAWRHTATQRAEALIDAIGRGTGKVVKKVDHYAEPEEEAA